VLLAKRFGSAVKGEAGVRAVREEVVVGEIGGE